MEQYTKTKKRKLKGEEREGERKKKWSTQYTTVSPRLLNINCYLPIFLKRNANGVRFYLVITCFFPVYLFF